MTPVPFSGENSDPRPSPRATRANVPTPAHVSPPELKSLLTEAHRLFHAKNPRQAAHVLSQAEALAKHHNLHREAAQYRQALTILAQGGTPKLLGRKKLL